MDDNAAVDCPTESATAEVDVLKQTLTDVIRLLEKRGLSRREIADDVRLETIVSAEPPHVADLNDVACESGFDLHRVS